jgi:hypothetical protein
MLLLRKRVYDLRVELCVINNNNDGYDANNKISENFTG